MENYTTFETSVKLEEKGFPQPIPGKGQIWHGKEGAYQVMTVQYENFGVHESTVYSHRVGSTQVFDMPTELFIGFIYAATPADLLKELGPKYIYFYMNGIYYCNRVGVDSKSWAHENPAECLSLAYLDN